MSIFSHPEFDHHEKVLFCHDEGTGLIGIIAVHSTALGPAAGGCRMHPYASVDDALTDVLRLSKGMSYKNAMAGLPLGGGKCVIIADPSKPGKDALLRAFSHHVQDLGGKYWTAIDVGVGPDDADVMAENCDYIFARASMYEEGFNPSRFTALGGFTSLRAGVEHVWDRKDLTGIRVAIQGLGATGQDLARQLHEQGASLVVADINDAAVRFAVSNYGAVAVDPSEIHKQDVDVFAPCAFGAGINDATLPEIRAKLICGLANNQLAEPRHGQALLDRGITYVPDYIANGGGMMGAGARIYSEPTDAESCETILGLHGTILELLSRASDEGRPTSDVADQMARERISGV